MVIAVRSWLDSCIYFTRVPPPHRYPTKTIELIRILLSRRRRERGGESREEVLEGWHMALLFQLLKFRGWKRPPFSSLLDSCPSPRGSSSPSLASSSSFSSFSPFFLSSFSPSSRVLYSRNELQSLVSSGSTCLSNSRDDYRYRWENVGQT